MTTPLPTSQRVWRLSLAALALVVIVVALVSALVHLHTT